MKIKLKYPVKVGKILLPKGTEGQAICLTKSDRIKESFPNIKESDDGFYYIIRFPNLEDILLDKTQIEF